MSTKVIISPKVYTHTYTWVSMFCLVQKKSQPSTPPNKQQKQREHFTQENIIYYYRTYNLLFSFEVSSTTPRDNYDNETLLTKRTHHTNTLRVLGSDFSFTYLCLVFQINYPGVDRDHLYIA